MKTENLDKAFDLLIEYHNLIQLRKEASETFHTVTELSDKLNQSIFEDEIAHCQIEIANNIQRLILNSERNRFNFKYYVLRYGLWIATTKLDLQIGELKRKIEQLYTHTHTHTQVHG